VQGQKMIKLPQGPDPGVGDMNGGAVVVGCKIDQLPVTNPFDRPGWLYLQKICEFVESGAYSLDRADGKIPPTRNSPEIVRYGDEACWYFC